MRTQEIYEELSGVWWKDCPQCTIKIWAREFRYSRTNTCIEPGSGRQKKKCNHQREHRRCSQHGDDCPTSDSSTDSGHIRPYSYGTVNRSLHIKLKVTKCAA